MLMECGFTLVPGSPPLQRLSNRSQELSSHVRAIRLHRSGRECLTLVCPAH